MSPSSMRLTPWCLSNPPLSHHFHCYGFIQPRSTMSYLNYGSGFLPFYGAVSWLALDTPVHSPSSRWTDYQHLNCRYDSALYLLESLLLFFLSFQEKSRAFNMCWKALESKSSLNSPSPHLPHLLRCLPFFISQRSVRETELL